MTVEKNDLVFDSEEKNYFPEKQVDYSKPRHIVVSGSWEQIGYDLANLAKNSYNVALEPYQSPIHGAARRAYMTRNWPEMADM